mmetsp:Transcript_2410/g.3685  ORF Transcript_2410/g.3685 Transcript_2410/m.3685 type:complete len:87 (+) Transcript_2410:65-325(+)
MSGHPQCSISFDYPKGHENSVRKFFTSGDNLCGKIEIKTTVENQRIEHQGIRISLLGMVLQLPEHAHTGRRSTHTGMVSGLSKDRS